MSSGPACHCKHPDYRSQWRVSQRHCSRSAFNGYRQTYSDWSEVVCLACGARWRTKARYVATLPDLNYSRGLR